MTSWGTSRLKLVESNVPTLRMPPADQGQVDPPRRRAQRAEERKRRGSPILQFAPDATIRRRMPLNRLQHRGIHCNGGIYCLVRTRAMTEPPTGLDPVRRATSQVGSVYGSCRMMRPMQFCSFTATSRMYVGTDGARSRFPCDGEAGAPGHRRRRRSAAGPAASPRD